MPTKRIVLSLVSMGLLIVCSVAKSDKELFDEINKFENCLVQASFNFVLADYNPPKTPADFQATCKRQSEGIKCLKTKTKGSGALVRRGLATWANTRSRQHKKLCSNLNSSHAKKFLAASKCAMEKRLDQLKMLDIDFAKTVIAVVQKNYNDSAPELKQLCCAMHKYKSGILSTASEGCPDHRPLLEELVSSIVTEDVAIVCEDDEKVEKSCLKLEKLPTDRIQVEKWPLPTVMSLYAFSTLGEPSEQPISFA